MEHQLDGLLEAVYEAAVEPGRWPAALARICDAVGRSAAFVITTRDFVEPVDVWLARFDPACAERRLRDYARPEDNPAVRAYCTMPPLTLRPRTSFLSDCQFIDHPCAQDVMGCQGLFYSCIATLERRAGLLSSMAVLRPKSAGDFEPDEVAFLQRLIPHLARAQQVHRRAADAQLYQRQSEQTLDALDFGLILLAADRHILFANRMAAGLLRAGEALSAHQGRLRGDPAELAALLATAAGRSGPRIGGAIALARRLGRRPLQVLTVPLARDRSTMVEVAPCADIALMLIDPDTDLQPITALLRSLHGLTEAEARLASGLLAGQRLEDYADRAGITINTARTQLRSVFGKTGTDRQAELVRLLAWTMYAPKGR